MCAEIFLLLIQLLKVQNFTKSCIIFAGIAACGFGIYLIIRGARKRKKGVRWLGGTAVLLLVLDIILLAPYLNPTDTVIPLEPVEVLETGRAQLPQEAFTCYFGWEYNRDPAEISEELELFGACETADKDLDHYTYIYLFGRKADAISVNIWDNGQDIALPFLPPVYRAVLRGAEPGQPGNIYIYRIPKGGIEVN